jgi:protein involved in polysaccharide export with SLBB domain
MYLGKGAEGHQMKESDLRGLFTVALLALVPVAAVAQVTASNQTAVTSAPAGSPVAGYRMGGGDKLRMTIYGEPDLSGEFAVNGAGVVSLPLIGDVGARGLTVSEFATAVEDKFKAGYLLDPKVSVEITNFRPYYIMGEVGKAGEYGYSDGLTVMNAIARAEGFTYRAQQKRIFIKPYGKTVETEVPLTADLVVQPGDTIRIAERHF